MINKSSSALSIAFMFLVLMGCAFAPARKVLIRPGQGGVVAIPHADSGRGRANEIMREVCQSKKYEIVEEAETGVSTVVDKTTEKFRTNSTTGDPVNYNAGMKRSSEEISNRIEWRISFKCAEGLGTSPL